MTLKQCFEMFGGNYESVLSRMGKEERVRKFVLKFKSDPTFDFLTESLANANYTEAFRAAHTIKGLCQNLGFDRLFRSSSALTEALRGGKEPDNDLYYKQVKEDYAQIINAIQLLDEQ